MRIEPKRPDSVPEDYANHDFKQLRKQLGVNACFPSTRTDRRVTNEVTDGAVGDPSPATRIFDANVRGITA